MQMCAAVCLGAVSYMQKTWHPDTRRESRLRACTESWKVCWPLVLCQYLLGVPLCVRQLCGHVEHDLLVAVVAVYRFGAGLPVSHIQPSAETAGTTKSVSDRIFSISAEARPSTLIQIAAGVPSVGGAAWGGWYLLPSHHIQMLTL